MHKKRESLDHPSVDRREFLKSGLASASLLALPSGFNAQTRSNLPAIPPPSSVLIRNAASAFLTALAGDKLTMATFPFADEQRFDWHFIPRPRKGVSLKELDPAQRHLALALLGASLSPSGLARALTVMSLDDVLRQTEPPSSAIRRDPDLYYVSLFGKPESSGVWGWRFEGHHLSFNFTLKGDTGFSSSPMFFGANPAEVRDTQRKGLRALAMEEDLARDFLQSLDDRQRSSAIVSETAPGDILSFNKRKAERLAPAGLQAGKLGRRQADLLVRLIQHYVYSIPLDVAKSRMDRVRASQWGNISFAWAGKLERGQPHYYRIQGDAFLIEYDNTQNNANHIHSVWRDFNGDFGLDLLAEHYGNSHR